MEPGYLGLIELLVVAGLVLGFSAREVVKMRRDLERNRGPEAEDGKTPETEKNGDRS